MGSSLAPASSMSVSYTHLDVYKRQIRRIGNLYTELHVSKVIMLQGITVVDVKVTVGNATENHVHSGKVVGGGSKLLTIVVTHICIVFEAQQKRAGATSGIGCVLDIR